MFDTMTFTKALGAICGSLLVFLLLGWAGSSLYTMGGGHGGEEVAQAYTIDTGAEAPAEEGAAEAEAAAPFADLVVIGVKWHQLKQAIEQIRPFVGPQTVVLSLLNGIESEAVIARELGVPAVVGTSNALDTIEDGQTITVSCAQGDTGFIYDKALEFEKQLRHVIDYDS